MRIDQQAMTCECGSPAFYPEARPCMADLAIDGDIERLDRLYAWNSVEDSPSNEVFQASDFLPHVGAGGKWLKGMTALLRDSEGRAVGAIETVEDITERKRAEEMLAAHRKELEALVAERTRELSDINAALQREIAERREAEAALSRARDELEHQVEQRTEELRRLNEALTSLSLQDGLTGISNRRYLDEFLQREWQRARRDGSPVAVIMADVDCFKAYNDTYGHIAGDTCLKAVAGVLKATAKRAIDLAARYGGEEFAVVLPDTGLAAALALAEEARASVEALCIEHRTTSASGTDGEPAHFVTISLGVACLTPDDGTSAADVVAAADGALYQAKDSGRNRVAAAPQLVTHA